MCTPVAAAQAAIGVGSSLMDSNAQQQKQDADYNQLKWGIEGRNIAKRGETLRNQDYYKQTAWDELDTATRAYLKTDIELDQAISKANLAAQTNLANLIKGSGRGSAKGLGGSSAQRIDMQAIKNWGQQEAITRHGIREKALTAEFNKEVDQKRAGDAIKIAGRKLGVDRSTIFEGTPQGPEPVNPWPGLLMAGAEAGLGAWKEASAPSPFNFPGDSGFDASKAFSGDPNILGDWTKNLDLGLVSNPITPNIGASPFSGLNSMKWSSLTL